jgi:hypothetical protein
MTRMDIHILITPPCQIRCEHGSLRLGIDLLIVLA